MKNKIQCLECKKYYKFINHFHLKSCCGLTVSQYREKYHSVILSSKYYRENMSIVQKESYKNGYINPNKGKKLSDSHKQNLKIAAKESYKNGRIHPMQDKNHTDITKQKMKDNHADVSGENNPMFGKTHTEKSKQKQRVSRINEIEEKHGQLSPNYNPNACKFFDYINEEFSLNGYHAENMGEFHIKELGYFVDYYEPDLNIVIEIEDFLNCKFIRINQDKSNWQNMKIEMIEELLNI